MIVVQIVARVRGQSRRFLWGWGVPFEFSPKRLAGGAVVHLGLT